MQGNDLDTPTKADFFNDPHLNPDEIDTRLENENVFTGLDPVHNSRKTRTLVERAAQTSTERRKKVFTLVNIYAMTKTMFEAVRPPVAVVLGGEEGGMQRALLCSEDWISDTLDCELVLGMQTRVWDKMDPAARVRGLKRRDYRGAMGDLR